MQTTNTKDNPIIAVAAIVKNDEGKLLIGYDGEKQKYAFIGGYVEPGEELAEAAIREVFEETGGNYGKGIRCKIICQLYEKTFFREDKQEWHKTIGFLAEYISGELADDPDEQRSDWKFMDPYEVQKLDLFTPAKTGLANYLDKFLTNHGPHRYHAQRLEVDSEDSQR